jgi:hypothetical protein
MTNDTGLRLLSVDGPGYRNGEGRPQAPFEQRGGSADAQPQPVLLPQLGHV